MHFDIFWFSDKNFQNALKEINAGIRKYDAVAGIHEVHPTPEKIRKYIEGGYRFIACGIDTLFISNTSQALLRDIRQ